MQIPNKKQTNKLTPEIMYKPVIQFLLLYGRNFYNEFRRCPYCKSSDCKKHNIIEKIFCKLIVNGKFVDVKVYVQVYYCKKCKKTYLAKSPFYRGIMYCKPIINLCLYLSAKNPYHRVENRLLETGIQVDRDTVRKYAIKFEAKMKKFAGMKWLDNEVGINLLKAMFDVDNVKELRKKYPNELYDGVADETYPRIKGAKKKFDEENKRRKMNKKDLIKYPKSFTLSVSYLSILRMYVSVIINKVSFNQLFASILLLPLLGADFITTDGHGAYNLTNKFAEHLRCLFHRLKNLGKKDKKLRKMQKEKKSLEKIKEYLSKKYRDMLENELKILKKKFRKYFDENNNFLGAITTNSIEGGNWRIKFELRTAYSVKESITARAILICLNDSIFTFRKGCPNESFAHKHSNFSYEKIMEV
jgi:transposase-like protein